MNINLELYRVFYEVAKKGNITAASRSLLISQPAISKSIKTLESNLGGTLFIRNKKGVILTDEGRELYNYISKGMEFIEMAENKFKELINLETGIIRIGSSTTLTKMFLLKYLEKYKECYPNIKIQILTLSSKELFKKLKEGLLDLVIYNSPCEEENDVNFTKIKEIHGAFYVGNKYKDLVNKKLTLKDLNDYPLILQHPLSNTRKFLDEFCYKEEGVVLKEVMNASSYTLAYEFCKNNYGICFLSDELLEDDHDKSVYRLNVSSKIPNRYISIAYYEKNGISFSTRKLIEIMKKDID